MFCPGFLLFLFVAFLIGIVVVLKRLRAQEPEHGPSQEQAPTASPPASTLSPTPVVQDLETMRLAVEQMETAHIENVLDMGATLRPGAEQIFRTELEERRAGKADPED